MSKRLIYAEDAIFALDALFVKQIKQFGYDSYEKADEKTQLVCDGISESIGCLLELPSAQPENIARDIATIIENEKDMRVMLQQRWIPTSKTETIPDHEVLCCDRYENQMVGYLTNDHGEWICESDSEVMYDTVAWMEKPEPYKGEGR